MDAPLVIEKNLARVYERIAVAARRVGRGPEQIRLVAVTKTHPSSIVAEAWRIGLRDFGENRVGEAADKIPGVEQQLADGEQPRWHMIGHLQRRKARLAVALFDMIHSVDSIRLARRISRMASEAGKIVPIFLEINVSGEASKYGFDRSPVAETQKRTVFMDAVEQILELPRLQPVGLMTMAPVVDDPEQARPVFSALRRVRDELEQRFPEADWRELSMGMTDDFEVAIEEGATVLRIGRAIFGERKHP